MAGEIEQITPGQIIKVNVSISHVWDGDIDLKMGTTLGIYVSGKLVARVGKEHKPGSQAADAHFGDHRKPRECQPGAAIVQKCH